MADGAVRFKYLDGLRGAACLMVVAYHYVHYFAVSQKLYAVYAAYPALGIFSDGRLAVYLFFLISGFVLTKSSAGRQNGFASAMLARMIRLWLPSGAAVLIAFLAYRGVGFAPHLAELRDGMTGLLTGYSKMSLFEARWLPRAANPAFSPFWTISVELAGSAVIFALTAARAHSRIAYRAALLAVILLLGDNELQLFIAGHLCAIWKKFEASAPWLSAAGTAGILLSFYATSLWPANLFRSGWDIGIFALPYDFNVSLALCAAAIFLCIPKSRLIVLALESPLLQFLGRVSFPVYLLHMSVIVTFGAYLTGRQVPPFFIAPACLALILALADLFERAIDAPAIALGRRMTRRRAEFAPLPQAGRYLPEDESRAKAGGRAGRRWGSRPAPERRIRPPSD